MFTEAKPGEESKVERDFKKLLTVTKSKFYMLRVNYPEAFESVNHEIADNTVLQDADYDPLAAKVSNDFDKVKQAQPLTAAAGSINLNEDESEENKKKRKEVLDKDKKAVEAMDKQTEELIKQMEVLKKVDEFNKDRIEEQKLQAKKVKYIDREEDLELKKMYEEEQKRFESLSKELAGKVEGEIDMDMHGNIQVKHSPKAKQEEAKEGI